MHPALKFINSPINTIRLLLSVIIVNYNVKYFLEHCLRSVAKAGRTIDMEVFVIDNSSVDNSRHYLQAAFNKVNFIWLDKNTGFSKACNEGLKHARGQYILFLNPDTIIPEDCFEKCIDFFKSTPGAGGLGVRMIDGSGVFLKESKRGFPSLIRSLFKFSGIIHLFPRSGFFAGYYMGNLPETETNKVDVLSGACMFVPSHVLKVTGGFDEAFFMYGEDIDLSYRIQKAGYINYYYPGISIIHFKGESTVKNSRKYVQTFYKAMRIFVRKHYPCLQALLYTVFVSVVMLVSMVLAACKKVLIQGGKKNAGNQYPNTFIVNGTGDEYVKAAAIIKQNIANVLVFSNTRQEQAKNANDLVLCEGAASFKEIIEKLSLLSRKYQIWFWSAESRSIITSDSKKGLGKTIPAY